MNTDKKTITFEEAKEQVAKIIRENITFSGQIGDYVIHGAIEKLFEWRELYASQQNAELKEELYKSQNLWRKGNWISKEKVEEQLVEKDKTISQLQADKKEMLEEIERLKGIISKIKTLSYDEIDLFFSKHSETK